MNSRTTSEAVHDSLGSSSDSGSNDAHHDDGSSTATAASSSNAPSSDGRCISIVSLLSYVLGGESFNKQQFPSVIAIISGCQCVNINATGHCSVFYCLSTCTLHGFFFLEGHHQVL